MAGKDHLRADRGGVGIEYRPLMQRNLRYHAVIAHKTDFITRIDDTQDTIRTWQYIVGMAAKI